MKEYIIYFLLFLLCNCFEIEDLDSFEDTNIIFNEDKKYYIYKYLYTSKNNENKGRLIFLFNKGEKIATNINIYYDETKIEIKDNKFINSIYSQDLFGVSLVYISDLNEGILYIVISNFISTYDDSFKIFSEFEYHDISNKKGYIHLNFFDRDFQEKDYTYITLLINNTNLNNSFFHYKFYSYSDIKVKIITSNETIIDSNEVIPLDNYLNETIFIKISILYSYAPDSPMTKFLFYFSNYSNLFPIPNKLNEPLNIPVINFGDYYLFSNINDSDKTFFELNVSNFIYYYYFETTDSKIIDEKVPFPSNIKSENVSSIELEENKYYFSIPKYGEYVSVVFRIQIGEDFYIMKINEPKNNKILIIIISVLAAFILIIIIIIIIICLKKKKCKKQKEDLDENNLNSKNEEIIPTNNIEDKPAPEVIKNNTD